MILCADKIQCTESIRVMCISEYSCPFMHWYCESREVQLNWASAWSPVRALMLCMCVFTFVSRWIIYTAVKMMLHFASKLSILLRTKMTAMYGMYDIIKRVLQYYIFFYILCWCYLRSMLHMKSPKCSYFTIFIYIIYDLNGADLKQGFNQSQLKKSMHKCHGYIDGKWECMGTWQKTNTIHIYQLRNICFYIDCNQVRYTIQVQHMYYLRPYYRPLAVSLYIFYSNDRSVTS